MKFVKKSLLAVCVLMVAGLSSGCRAPNVMVTGVVPHMAAGSSNPNPTTLPVQEVPPTWVKVVRSVGIRRNEVVVYNHTDHYLFVTRNGQYILHDQQKQSDGTYLARAHVIHPKGFSVVDIGLAVNDWSSSIIGAQAVRYDTQGRPTPVGTVYGQSYSTSSWYGPRTWEYHVYEYMIIK